MSADKGQREALFSARNRKLQLIPSTRRIPSPFQVLGICSALPLRSTEPRLFGDTGDGRYAESNVVISLLRKHHSATYTYHCAVDCDSGHWDPRG
jgi:hypothetical protein